MDDEVDEVEDDVVIGLAVVVAGVSFDVVAEEEENVEVVSPWVKVDNVVGVDGAVVSTEVLEAAGSSEDADEVFSWVDLVVICEEVKVESCEEVLLAEVLVVDGFSWEVTC